MWLLTISLVGEPFASVLGVSHLDVEQAGIASEGDNSEMGVLHSDRSVDKDGGCA